jgi:hypothetical protein
VTFDLPAFTSYGTDDRANSNRGQGKSQDFATEAGMNRGNRKGCQTDCIAGH